MTIVNVGSINIDNAYRVTRHPAPGETILDKGYLRGLGGKGANMSLAAAAAGAGVRHVGAVGADGEWCRDKLAAAGVDVEDLAVIDVETGHAVIMVDDAGENIIVVHSGANHALTMLAIEAAIARAAPGDWLLLQAETNLVPEAAHAARAAGLRVAYAAAPFEAGAAAKMLPLADLLAVNEVEGAQLARATGRPVEDLGAGALLMTLGRRGAVFMAEGRRIVCPAFEVEAVDTTGAGDTFLGFFLAGLDQGAEPAFALRRASAAAALQCTRPGAGEAIPMADEVDRLVAANQRTKEGS